MSSPRPVGRARARSRPPAPARGASRSAARRRRGAATARRREPQLPHPLERARRLADQRVVREQAQELGDRHRPGRRNAAGRSLPHTLRAQHDASVDELGALTRPRHGRRRATSSSTFRRGADASRRSRASVTGRARTGRRDVRPARRSTLLAGGGLGAHAEIVGAAKDGLGLLHRPCSRSNSDHSSAARPASCRCP